MHSRNIYQHPPDFGTLADSYEALRPYLISEPGAHRKTIDFKDAEAQRRLTEAIMFRDFGITLHIPHNRLCPPVPNRLNYVLWIQDVVHAHNSILGSYPRPIHGIDIGTGSSAIYPFLACKLEPDWRMIGTELDEYSYAFAQKNVSVNGMESRIDVRRARADGPILFPLEDEVNFEFTMCNPPFYASAQEVIELAEDKELPPNAVCTGSEVEMIYSDGGEAGFVRRMVEESIKPKPSASSWYTSMLGKMSSILSIVELLRQHSITNYAITEFVQGQTRRWAIAWSFTDTHLPDSVARISFLPSTHPLYPVLPPRNTLVQPFACTAAVLREAVEETVQSLDLQGVQVTPSMIAKEEGSSDVLPSFLVEAQANTWSRSARRGRKRQVQAADDTHSQDLPRLTTTVSPSPSLTCSIRTIAPDSSLTGNIGSVSVEFQWIFGRDRALFESFTSHISRKVALKVQARRS
ncbi:S-adenosyl-L-methionine dependent methyltransferase [Pholiota molesta]|nr:S-adenosyl-L-methionine dependent methyltransferase [Pholiota molesta]